MKLGRIIPLMLFLVLTLPAAMQAQFTLTSNNGVFSVTGYTGTNPVVIIPSSTNGYPVTSIGFQAFYDSILKNVRIPNSVTNIGHGAFIKCIYMTNITIGDGVTSIGSNAFASCIGLTNITIPKSVTNIADYTFSIGNSLKGIYFKGDAPNTSSHLFQYDNSLTVYYLPGTTGWSNTFAGRPTVLWNPQVQTSDTSFGVRTNQFGFTVFGDSNLVIVVEVCTNLINPTWSAVTTKTLTGGSSYFSDPQWTNRPAGFYRFRSP